jgi:hypothetical protein
VRDSASLLRIEVFQARPRHRPEWLSRSSSRTRQGSNQ